MLTLERTPKQRLDRRPNLYATLRGSSVYLLAYRLLGSFADECYVDCSSCAHCMGAKLQIFNEIMAFLFHFYRYLSMITDILPSETPKNEISRCYLR